MTKKKLRMIVLLAAAVLLVCSIAAAGLFIFCHASGDSRTENAVEACETADENEADDDSGPPLSRKLKVAGQFMWADFKDWVSRKFSNRPPASNDPF